MKKQLKHHLISPALLLFAAVLGVAGCSQSDGIPSETTVVTARGGEPLHISVGFKPCFTPGDNTPGTRATVGDDGTFSWTTNDQIYVYITYNDAAATKYVATWHYKPEGTSQPNMTDWFSAYGWSVFGGVDGGAPIWPKGASRATVQAFYTDCKLIRVDGDAGDPTKLTFDYTEGTGDHMIYTKTISIGENITLDFSHSTTRLVFKGLKPDTNYELSIESRSFTFPVRLTVADFSLGTLLDQTLTSDADGTLVVCAALNDKIDANGKVKLELVGDATIGTVELIAQGTTGNYTMDGSMYTASVVANGEVDPDSRPDLLPVPPIVPGNTVYEVNGYWVTAPDGDEKKLYAWASSSSASIMESDPCAGYGNWRMPTMKDFEKMAGWTISWPWSQEVTGDAQNIASNTTRWGAAFPSGRYWSSVARTPEHGAWYMNSFGNDAAYYHWDINRSIYYVRCVQKK